MNSPKTTQPRVFSNMAPTPKQVPIAIFAVIAVHVILFLLLLVAAGVRAASRHGQAPVGTDEAAGLMADYRPDEPALAAGPVLATEPDDEPPAMMAEAVLPVRANRVPLSAAGFYVVRAGDTLSHIAKDHRTTVQTLRVENNLKADRLQIGQRLRIAGGRRVPDA